MLVLGGSVYAVMTAVRLARKGYKVKLVHDRARVGVFPQALLPEEFFGAAGVEPEIDSEAVFDDATIMQNIVKLPTRLYLVRTTPVLEKALAVNRVTFSNRLVSESGEVVDCRPERWRHFRLIQMLAVNRNGSKRILNISFQKNQYVKVTATGDGTSLTYVYFNTGFNPSRDLIACAEIFFYYKEPKPRPVVSWLGQDVAEAMFGEATESGLATAAPFNVESYLTGVTEELPR